eukprot:SAG31_NODE_1602_length_7780_cov_8.304699_7_plen_259_part_00
MVAACTPPHRSFYPAVELPRCSGDDAICAIAQGDQQCWLSLHGTIRAVEVAAQLGSALIVFFFGLSMSSSEKLADERVLKVVKAVLGDEHVRLLHVAAGKTIPARAGEADVRGYHSDWCVVKLRTSDSSSSSSSSSSSDPPPLPPPPPPPILLHIWVASVQTTPSIMVTSCRPHDLASLVSIKNTTSNGLPTHSQAGDSSSGHPDERREYHHCGAVAQPFPDATFCLSTIWLLSRSGPDCGGTYVVRVIECDNISCFR